MSSVSAIVHIGVEKTGTTYIQQFLRLNAEALAERGVGYPGFLNRSARDNNHHALAAYAVDAAGEQDIHRFHGVTSESQAEFRAALRRRLATEVSATAYRRWVFSSEHLSSRALSPESVKRLVELMRGADLDPRIVVVLRPQEDMIESAFSTAIVSGNVEPFDFDEAVADRARHDFRDLLVRWERVVGRDAITVHPYRDDAPSDALANLVCHELDIPIDGLALPDKRANASLSYVQAELLRRFTDATRGRPRATALVRRPALVRALSEVHGAPFRLTAAERARVREVNDESNDWVAEHYGVTLRHREARGDGDRPDVFSGDDFAAFAEALASSLRGRRRPPPAQRR
jgi:hypothetical protein